MPKFATVRDVRTRIAGVVDVYDPTDADLISADLNDVARALWYKAPRWCAGDAVYEEEEFKIALDHELRARGYVI